MSVCCKCCVSSGRGLCDALITRPEESYRPCCVVVCDLETSRMRRSWPALGHSATGGKKIIVRNNKFIRYIFNAAPCFDIKGGVLLSLVMLISSISIKHIRLKMNL